MARPVQHMHSWLDELWELRVRLHGFRQEVMVVDARAVVACPEHCSAHAAVQIDYPNRHLPYQHSSKFTGALSQPKR